jgi:hypothetical protein
MPSPFTEVYGDCSQVKCLNADRVRILRIH